MLYDSKWERKPSLEGFARWLEQQPAEEQYVWGACSACACANYMRHLTGNPFEWPEERMALERLAKDGRRTYGELLLRVRAALAAHAHQ